jgi:hypothetical protein
MSDGFRWVASGDNWMMPVGGVIYLLQKVMLAQTGAVVWVIYKKIHEGPTYNIGAQPELADAKTIAHFDAICWNN